MGKKKKGKDKKWTWGGNDEKLKKYFKENGKHKRSNIQSDNSII